MHAVTPGSGCRQAAGYRDLLRSRYPDSELARMTIAVSNHYLYSSTQAGSLSMNQAQWQSPSAGPGLLRVQHALRRRTCDPFHILGTLRHI